MDAVAIITVAVAEARTAIMPTLQLPDTITAIAVIAVAIITTTIARTDVNIQMITVLAGSRRPVCPSPMWYIANRHQCALTAAVGPIVNLRTSATLTRRWWTPL